MNKRQKKRLRKTFDITWAVAGIALIIITAFSVIKLKTTGTTSEAVFFATSLYSLTVYITITIILIVIKEIIKRVKQF